MNGPVVEQRLPHTRILGVPVSAMNLELSKQIIRGWVENGESRYVCVPDASGLVRARTDPSLMAALEGADMVAPDGVPSVYVSRLRGAKHVGRVTGLDLLPQLCQFSAQFGWRHFFYGGAEGVAAEAGRRLHEANPGMVVAGSYCPPFRELTDQETVNIVDRINAAQPHIVWVGLGLPKQEKWSAEHVGKIPGATLIGIGFALDVAAGLKTRAPVWMQKIGLEWLYRLITEPRRLWKRYLVTIPTFIWLVTIEQVRRSTQKLRRTDS